jgi:hypothetical protein
MSLMNPRLLRPLASGVHPEANAWRTAVVANGGSVSASTMKAVSTFCAAIDLAGIRDRFYRLNLFAGTGLNACLVPLYRGQSRTGTQYGNTTDTNVGPFVSGDYAETGASGGLKGNGTSKYLDTGFLANTLTQSGRHLGVVFQASTVEAAGRYWFGTDNFGCDSNAFWGVGTSSSTSNTNRCSNGTSAFTNTISGKPHVLVSGNGAAASYVNGSAGSTINQTAFTAPAQAIYIFAQNRCNTPADYSPVRVLQYSIGDSMTAGQVSSLNTALAAFQTALSRA